MQPNNFLPANAIPSLNLESRKGCVWGRHSENFTKETSGKCSETNAMFQQDNEIHSRTQRLFITLYN